MVASFLKVVKYMRDYLYSILSTFREGSTFRGYCPSCGGRDTFTAIVSGGMVLYNCYRAGCDAAGRYNINLSTEEKVSYLKERHSRIQAELPHFVMPDYWIDGIGNDQCVSYMTKTNTLSSFIEGRFRPMYDPAERRFVFPIREGSEVVGGIGRSLIGAYPKTLNYNEQYIKPFKCGTGKIALLVEDCASAVAATRSPLVSGVALLGTNVRQDFILALSEYEWIGVALDPDAFSKSIRVRAKIAPFVKDARILKLPKDIKDLDDAAYLSFLDKNGLSSI